jgi:hypothetical protein
LFKIHAKLTQLHCRVIDCQRVLASEDKVVNVNNTDDLCSNEKTEIKFGLFQSTCFVFRPKSSRALPKSVKSLLQFETFLCSVLQKLSKTQGHINIDVFTWFKICMKESTGNITLL